MINKKRGNIFESLSTNEDYAATFWDQDERESDLKDSFESLEKRLKRIDRDSSEVKEDLKNLRNQIEDLKETELDSVEILKDLEETYIQVVEVKRYFEENCEDEGEVFEINDDFFRLAYINKDDERGDLYADHENEEELWRKTDEIAEVTMQLMQVIIKKRESKERKNHLPGHDESQGGWILSRRGKKRFKKSRRSGGRKQRRPTRYPDLPSGSMSVYRHYDTASVHDGDSQVQSLEPVPRQFPQRDARVGGLPQGAWPPLRGGGGDANQETQGHEDPRGLGRPERGAVQVRRCYAEVVRVKTPGHNGDPEEAHGDVEQGGEDDNPRHRMRDTINDTLKLCDFYISNLFLGSNTKIFKGNQRYDNSDKKADINMISDKVESMTKGQPTKCPVCSLELPSITAMKAHRSSAHPTPSKPPGPSNKTKEMMKKIGTPARANKNASGAAGAVTISTTPVRVNNTDDQKSLAESSASPKLSETPSTSAGVMSRWMQGATRSNKIGDALANKSDNKDKDKVKPKVDYDKIEVVAVETLNESINLLEDAHVTIRDSTVAPGPRVSTMTFYPPNMEAVPLLDESGSWILRQSMTDPTLEEQEQEFKEPEKPKRARERYEDDRSHDGKKLDEKSTPEEIRANVSVRTADPRNLSRDLLSTQEVMENMETMESMEFGSQDHLNIQSAEWDIEGHNVKLVDASATNTEAQSERPMSAMEQDWMVSDSFSTIPPSPPRDSQNTEDSQETQGNYGNYGEDTENVVYFKNAKIEELEVRLEEALSNNQDNDEKIGSLENQVSDLTESVKHYRGLAEKINENAATNCSKLMADAELHKKELEEQAEKLQMARAEKESMKNEMERLRAELAEKMMIINTAATEVENVKAESMDAMRQIQAHVERIESEAEEDKRKANQVEEELKAKYDKLEGEKRAEIERISAVSKKALGEIKVMQEERKQMMTQSNEITGVKAALVKAQGEVNLEKLKAEKAEDMVKNKDDMLKKLEDILKDTQEQKLVKENRISTLENKIKLMYRDLPCDRPDCDKSCGKDHHCGTPSIRTGRRRSRSRKNSENEKVPTVANLASQAGTTVEKMQQLVNEQAARLPPKPPVKKNTHENSGNVAICKNFHYAQLCIRGDLCRFAHDLVPAYAMAGRPQIAEGGGRVFTQAMNNVQNQPQPQPRPRSKSTGRQYPVPAYNKGHPDYAWIMEQRAKASNTAQPQQQQPQQAPGNGTEQSVGVTSAQVHQPQSVRPKLSTPRKRTVSMSVPASGNSASSDNLEARRLIHQSLNQQASTTAQMTAMKDNKWRETMTRTLNLVSRAYPSQAGGRTPSRNSSVGTAGSSGQKDQE